MKLFPSHLAMLAGSMLVTAGCVTAPALVAPAVPAPLQPPAGQALVLETLASGVQIYECTARPGQPTAAEWVFRAPEAVLTDRAGRGVGNHFAGPTWQSADGSKVVGELKARDPSPDPSAIPWLLLGAKSSTGPGVFGQVRSIQRLQTVGGVAPTEPCSSANVQQIARVPYTAVYYFYRDAL